MARPTLLFPQLPSPSDLLLSLLFLQWQIAFWDERSRLSPPEYPPMRWAGAGYTWLPECAAQCPARALPHAVLMMPVPSPAPAQPSNIPTISYISAALQPAACSLQPPVANFLCRYLINAFGQYYFGWERAVKLPHFPSTIARHSFYIFHNPQCTQSYASNEPLNVGWERNKIPVDKVNHLQVSLSQFPQSWLEFVRVYPARC